MPTLADYRHALAVESGPYIGAEQYDVRAMGGSTRTVLACHVYPIQSGIPQTDLLIDRPLYRPNAVLFEDRHRYVQGYNPTDGEIVPDLAWTNSPISTFEATTYAELEAHTYRDLEFYTYEQLEGLDINGVGERFEVLGPFDVPTMHQLINDGLKQCWLVVEVAAIPAEFATRHDLGVIAPWVQDPSDILQVGVLAAGEDRNITDPFGRVIRGEIERDGGRMYLNTGSRSFQAGDLLYLRCLKRAYDHCRVAGGEFGTQAGLRAETDEAPVERDWLASAALVVAWRRFAHLLEPQANQRLIRDQQAAAAWFSDRCREHFTAPLPGHTLKPRRFFGPAVRT
jgi:hypothetical protein